MSDLPHADRTAAVPQRGPVPRSMEGTHPRAAARAARERRTIPNGIWGMALFLASETTLFGSLIATYFYLRLQSGHWPPRGIEAPSVALPLALTAGLLFTTIPMLGAAWAARRTRVGATWALVFVSMLIQCGYLAWQITSYISDLHKFSPSGSAYGSIYFTLIGADHGHVLAGIFLDVWVLGRLITGKMTNYRYVTVQNLAFFWVVVNLVTVAVTLTQVSPS